MKDLLQAIRWLQLMHDLFAMTCLCSYFQNIQKVYSTSMLSYFQSKVIYVNIYLNVNYATLLTGILGRRKYNCLLSNLV